MKKLLIVAVFLLLAMLCACIAEPEVTLPSTAATVPTTQTTVPETTQVVWTPYTGDRRDYPLYYYADGRDLEWEEDILYVADVFLGEVFANGHPLLTDMEFQTMFSMDGAPVEYKSHYDEKAREEFIRDINELIPRIETMEDYEILYALQGSVAKLRDLHSSVGATAALETPFPLQLEVFYVGDTPQLHAVVLPQAQEDLLFSKLVAINGIPTEELIGLCIAYVSYENTYALMDHARYMLTYLEPLSVMGVAEKDAKNAEFTFETDDGQQHSVTLAAVRNGNLTPYHLVGQTLYDMDSPLVRNTASPYWWEYEESSRMLYVRFNEITEDRSLNYSAFVKQLRTHISNVPNTATVVIDLRHNPGGTFHASLSHYLSSFLDALEGRKGYVLIDSSSYSSAIWLPSNLMLMSESALLVGTPGGQPSNFFASVHEYSMPNTGYGFRMSDTYWVTNPDDTADALTPDIVLHQSLADYIAGKDTVLEAIRTNTLPQPEA